MLTRGTRLRLVAFAVGSILLVSYAAVKYAGIANPLGSGGCTIGVDLTDSGGLFTGSEVDYRGVQIGKVRALQPMPSGVRAMLKLGSCSNPRIPNNVTATVADLSVIGQQYVNLVADGAADGYLAQGSVIPVSQTSLPLPTQVLLANLDSLATSVDAQKLAIVVSQLGVAVDGQTLNLRTLIDAGGTILQLVQQNLPSLVELVQDSESVLHTQQDVSPMFASWVHSLNLLSAELRSDDPLVRSLIDTAPSALATVSDFTRSVQGPLGPLLGNLVTGGQLLQQHASDIGQLLQVYPQLVADGSKLVTSDGRLRMGVVVGWGNPQPCTSGYGGTVRRDPADTSSRAPNQSAGCTSSEVRGTR